MKIVTVSTFAGAVLLLTATILAGCGYGVAITTPTPTPQPPTPKPPVSEQRALTASPGRAAVAFLSVSAGDRLTGTFTISGGSGNDVNFSIKDPTGNTVLTGGRVSRNWQFDFLALSTGSYQLVFDNSFSSVSNKAINLNVTIYPRN